jgi:hypothetical protein
MGTRIWRPICAVFALAATAAAEVLVYLKNPFKTSGPLKGGGPTQVDCHDLTTPCLYGIESHYQF